MVINISIEVLRFFFLEYIKQFTKGYTVNHVLHILMNFFLPHIGELNFKSKALYLGYMVKNLLAVSVGAQKPTSRDNYRYKRFVTSGALIKDLFFEICFVAIDLLVHCYI